MENMAIYNACREVPADAKKPFNNGKFSGTDINPMWRIKKLTEQFGPAGIGWYVADVTERCEEHGDMTIAVVTLNLYIKIDGEWSKPIYGTGGNVVVRKGSVSDEGYKMAYTDALSVACKALGIGADVWYEKDETKYTAKQITPPGAPAYDPAYDDPPKKEPPKFICADCGEVITPWIAKDGTTKKSVRQIAEESGKEYGRALCLKCIKKVMSNENAG